MTQSNSTGDLVQSIGADLSALVRQELRLAQDELAERARGAGRAAAMLGASGVFGALAAGSSAALLLRLLERRLGRTTAAAVATMLYGGGAGVLAARALAELRRVWPPVPEATLTGLQRDVRDVTGGPPST